MIRDGTENDLSNPFRRSLLSIENEMRRYESEMKIPLKKETVKKETVKKEKIIIEGEIIS